MADMWRRYTPKLAPSPDHLANLRPSTGYNRLHIQLSNGVYLQVMLLLHMYYRLISVLGLFAILDVFLL